MKKIVSTLCAATLSLVLVACGGGGSGQEASSDDAATTEKTEAVEEKTDEKEEAKAEDKQEQSRLAALVASLDQKAGVHMNYHFACDDLGTDLLVDSYVKGNSFFQRSTGTVAGYADQVDEQATVDGKAYSIDEDDKTAMYIMSSSALSGNQLMQDDLYSAMWTHAQQTDFTVEEREVDGVKYTVEVYPAPNAYQTGAAFYFAPDGGLAICIVDAYSGDVELPEEHYTAITFDNNVDDSLLSLEGYTIEEEQ